MATYDRYDCYELPATDELTNIKPRCFVFPGEYKFGITMGDGNFNTTVILSVEQACALANLLYALEYIDPNAHATMITNDGHTVERVADQLAAE